MFDQPILHTEQFHEMQQLLAEDFTQMLRPFFDDATGYLTEAEQSIQNGDEQAARDHIHTLKGASLNVGAARLSAICLHIEQLIRARASAEALKFIPLATEALGDFKREVQAKLKS